MKGLRCDAGVGSELDIALALAVRLLWLASSDPVLEIVEEDVAEVRLCFASSLGTYGPPANEHGTPCRTQLEHGDCSSHCGHR